MKTGRFENDWKPFVGGFVRVALLLSLLLLTACAPSAASSPEEREPRQVIRVGVTSLVANPTPQASAANGWLYWPQYDGLVAFGPGDEIRPAVAKSWTQSADGRVWTFALRDDVKWADGKPLVAGDVAFGLNLMIDKNWPQRSALAAVTAVRAIDTRTLELSTATPTPALLSGLPTVWLLPKAYYEQLGYEAFIQRPMGSGPFEMVDFQPNQSLTVANRKVPHAFRGRAQSDEIIFSAVPNADQALASLQRGEIDLLIQPAFTAGQLDQARESGATVLSFPAAPKTGTAEPVTVVHSARLRGVAIEYGGLFHLDGVYKVR